MKLKSDRRSRFKRTGTLDDAQNSMASPEPIPNPVSFALLNTQDCVTHAAQLCEFENDVFGPKFACSNAAMDCWTESGCEFCAAVSGEAVTGRLRIFGSASVLVTSAASRDRLVRGELTDSELPPWSRDTERDEPVLYLASIISSHSAHVAAMYRCLATDVEAFLRRERLVARSGFAIASGPAGLQHLTRSGFASVPGKKYFGNYELMTIDRAGARTEFWQRVLHPGALPPLAHSHPENISRSQTAWHSEAKSGDGDETRPWPDESRTQRYRRLKLLP